MFESSNKNNGNFENTDSFNTPHKNKNVSSVSTNLSSNPQSYHHLHLQSFPSHQYSTI
jgi:hypothetical protein